MKHKTREECEESKACPGAKFKALNAEEENKLKKNGWDKKSGQSSNQRRTCPGHRYPSKNDCLV